MLENPSKEQPGEVTIAAKKIPLIAECFYKLVGAPEGAKVRMEYKMSGDENDPWLMVDEKPNYKRAKQNVMRISLIPLTRERLNKTQLRLSVFKEDEEVGSVSFPLGSFRYVSSINQQSNEPNLLVPSQTLYEPLAVSSPKRNPPNCPGSIFRNVVTFPSLRQKLRGPIPPRNLRRGHLWHRPESVL